MTAKKNPSPAATLVAVPGAQHRLSPAQHQFNALTTRIAEQRKLLVAWDEAIEQYRQRMGSELAPLTARLNAERRRIALRMGQLLAADPPRGPGRMKRQQREALRDTLCDLLQDLIEGQIQANPGSAPDPELVALFDAHSEISHAEMNELEMEMAGSVLRGAFGEDAVDGIEADSADELIRAAAERAQARSAEQQAAGDASWQARRAAGKAAKSKSRAQSKTASASAAAQRAEAERATTQTVREVYRRLASSLHPDREPDAAERARKTALMQQVNQAYERADLLTLLTLQLQTEQIDAEHLAGLPEKRLWHFNVVLQDQLDALKQEVKERSSVLGPRARPGDLSAQFESHMREIKGILRQIEADLAALNDPRRRPLWLQALAEELADRDDESGFGDDDDLLFSGANIGIPTMADLLQAMAKGPPMPRQGRRKAGTKRR